MTIQVPHDWDGIGQALRSAYREHRGPPESISQALAMLNRID